jgi:hypothetical protein
MLPLRLDPIRQLDVFAVVVRNIAVPVDLAIVGKLAQMVFPGHEGSPPFETQAFQCVDPGKSNWRYLSFKLQTVYIPLIFDPSSQLGVFAVVVRNIAVPVDLAIVGKLAQMVFPGHEGGPPFETQAF